MLKTQVMLSYISINVAEEISGILLFGNAKPLFGNTYMSGQGFPKWHGGNESPAMQEPQETWV